MRTSLAVVFALWLGAFIPALATPAAFGGRSVPPTRTLQLREADEEAVAAALRSVSAQERLRAPAVADAPAPAGAGSRILHGEEADDCQFPYQVALLTDAGYFCGGSLIANGWVLTAAHCIPDAVQWIRVYAGNVKWRQAAVTRYVKWALIHGGYNAWAHDDVALLNLYEDIEEEECIKPIELETEGCGTDELVGELAIASGWGLTSDSSIYVEDHLKHTTAKVISNDECKSYYGYSIIDSGICTVSAAGNNGTLCSGDSGGPLVLTSTGRQVGINSFVSIYGCEASWPNGYARVPCHAEWIGWNVDANSRI